MKALVLALAALTCVGMANAQIWNESGDAGQSLGTAQNVTSAFNVINGNLDGNDGVDMYRINIVNAGNFGIDATGSSFDTMVYLFRADGTGVAGNDDWFGLQSAIGVGGPGAIPGLTNGIYYVAIGEFFTDPVDAVGNSLFDDTSFNGTPNALAGALDHFDGSGPAGSYTLAFQQGSVAPVPEPASMIALGLGAASLLRRRRASR